MARRWLGALLCALLIGVSSFDAYAEATQKNFSFTLEIETSYFALDLLDDFSDGAQPSRTINWSARDKFSGNFLLGAKVRRIRFTPPPLISFEQATQPLFTSQDIFRFQEVYRI
ncbi:MAG TPA: hypothetical protein VKH62_09590 [Candidatus Binatia bacterium]|nr:hypothetical protein [Candidatus Binatia bacterium]